MSLKRAAAAALACTMFTAACADDDPAATTASSEAMSVTVGEAFPAQRCEENRAAGTITYMSGFDFAAAASIIDVLVAKQKGYFEDLCLDVDVRPSDSSLNGPLVASGAAQFASAGSFNEVIRLRAERPDADFVVLSVEGKTAIDTLIAKAGVAELSDLEGATIGVKGQLPPSVQAMLAQAGLIAGVDYRTVPVEGYDPADHIAMTDIDVFPGYKSNEPGQIDRAGIAYTAFDPSSEGIPGSFGIIYSNRVFIDAHPTAVQDFMRATMLGLADAIADPAAASMIAVDFIENSGNVNGLSPDSETYRWETESRLITDNTPSKEPVGLPTGSLEREVAAYARLGLYNGDAPDISDAYDADVLSSIYDASHAVIWPTT